MSIFGYNTDRGLITKRWDHIERDPDRLAEVKARWANKPAALEVSKAWALVDVRWLIAEIDRLRVSNDQWERMVANRQREVERLRGLLARLEWAGTTCWGDGEDEESCPACGGTRKEGHSDGRVFRGADGELYEACWLAAELGR
jgi:hypothetical protein